ncbi:MAG: hypothetical protein KC731_36445, partial [Myxococcales bacterium]|nr:hypothetical protein [Myxococcales bacterium]
MTTGDISRRLDQRAKRYDRVVLQQGRLLTDDDFNASDELAAERARGAQVAIVGASGSPDTGFAIDDPRITGGEIDFALKAGHMFVGGHLLSLSEDATYAAQPDWLRQPPAERAAPTTLRHDFAYLDVSEQGVAAVEDEELREVALGGPDTTSRVRLMWQARLRQNVGATDCHDAWDALIHDLRDAGWELDPATGELLPSARLQVGFDESGSGGDLCDPAVAGGYLGAENQTVRVMLTGPDRMTWAFDNAEPVYRALVIERESDGRWSFELKTQPPDEERWPIAGELAEVLPVAAHLDNGEPIKSPLGHFTRVATSWDPATSRVILEPSPALDTALTAGDELFLRIWRRDALGTMQGEITFTPGTPVPLGATGARVTVSGDHRAAGVYWTFSLRPKTRDVVVPWSLLREAQAPTGPRRFVAPLGLISWHSDDGHVVDDCRRRYRRLTDEDGCCTVTVGDGVHSHGEFSSLTAAVAALPRVGGTVCLLRGHHVGAVTLQAKSNIRFAGCGPHSVWAAPEGQTALSLQECKHIRLENLHMVGTAAPVIAGRVKDRDGRLQKGAFSVDGFVVRDVEVRSKGSACVFLPRARNVEIAHCRLLMLGPPHETPMPAVFFGGRHLVLEHSLVAWEREGNGLPPWEERPHGGVQIAGASF